MREKQTLKKIVMRKTVELKIVLRLTKIKKLVGSELI